MPKLRTIFLILAGVVLVLGLALTFYNRFRSSSSTNLENKINTNIFIQNANTPTNTNFVPLNRISNKNINQNLNVNLVPSDPQAKIKSDLQRIARLFSEHFGSFSNRTNFANILNLKVYMTQRMQKWADEFVAEGRKNTSSQIYYGITTYALTSQIQKFDNKKGQAEILVSTQRRESVGSPSNTRFFNQNILIKFVKEKGIWKVDGAFWQK